MNDLNDDSRPASGAADAHAASPTRLPVASPDGHTHTLERSDEREAPEAKLDYAAAPWYSVETFPDESRLYSRAEAGRLVACVLHFGGLTPDQKLTHSRLLAAAPALFEAALAVVQYAARLDVASGQEWLDALEACCVAVEQAIDGLPPGSPVPPEEVRDASPDY